MRPAQSPFLFSFLPLALLASSLASCTTTAVSETEPQTSTGEAVDASSSKPKKQDDEASDEDLAEKLDELRHDVGEAEWEVAAAERNLAGAERSFAIWNEERELNRQEQADKLAKMDLSVHQAEMALQMFTEFDLPEETEDQALSIEGSEFRMTQAQQELDQMISDYERFAGEEYADKTGQIVIDRSRQQLEFSRRRLAMTRKEAEKVLQHEMPDKRRELELELQWTRNEATRAQREAQLAAREEEGERIEKEAAVEEARHELENARRDLRLARKELTEASQKGDS